MRNVFKVLYLIIGTATILEYIFITGMFTWLIVTTASVTIGSVNVIWEIKNKKYLDSLLYVMATVALVMGYLKIAY